MRQRTAPSSAWGARGGAVPIPYVVSPPYLPLGGRHFWSRRAYRLAYASQRETVYGRAMRARKLCLRLGGYPADDEYPDKPKRMRWTTYNRLMDRPVAADGVADERLDLLAARGLGR